MLRVLVESQAKRQRRGGGAALSVALHVAILGALAATAAHGTAASPEKVRPVILSFVPPVARTPVMRPTAVSATPSLMPRLDIVPPPRIAVPTVVPTTLPSIDASRGFSADSITAPLDRGTGGGSGIARGLNLSDDGSGSGAWKGNELLMHILSPARPRYPEALRQAGVDGHVLVRFVVDTTGRVDLASVQILNSTHELFSRAVRDALGNFRFKAAEVGGRRIAALAEMPFDFQIAR
jgi:protein TonB